MSRSVIFIVVGLVIIGLLFAGMLFAQNLIDGVQTKRFAKGFENYDTAVNLFKQKLGGLPGDTDKAEANWGRVDGSCAEVAGAGKTCNGNNNSQIDYEETRKFGYEPWRFWQQLSLSGIISDSYTGVMDNSCAAGKLCYGYTPKVNVPEASTSYSDIIVVFYVGKKELAWGGKKQNRNVYALGSTENYANPADKGRWWGQALTPTQAEFFDKKFDDGKPQAGKITAVGAEKTPNCVIEAKKEGLFQELKEEAKYNLAYPEKACALLVDARFN